MGDSRRFDLFAKLIHKNFPTNQYPVVADIAAGKGYLQTALREYGYNVTSFDKRKSRKNRLRKFQYQYRYFTSKVKDNFDLLVGMHPDEATDVIIVEAERRKIPFVLCPCCVKPNAITYFGKYAYGIWCTWLEKQAKDRGFRVWWTSLPMNGKNKVLIGRRNR